MKNIIKIVAFITYTITIFLIKNMYVLAGAFVLQIALMLITHISIRQALKNIMYLMPFIIFTSVINLYAMGLVDAVLIGTRLIIICNITYIYGKTTTAREISKGITSILYPCSKVGINVNNIGIIISISITLIPIISKEIESIKYSLISKGFKMSFWNQITHINYIMVPLFFGIIKKVGDMEETLISKGYIA